MTVPVRLLLVPTIAAALTVGAVALGATLPAQAESAALTGARRPASGAAASAGACSAARLTTSKTHGARAVSRRETALAKLTARVTSAGSLTAAHRSTLQSTLSSTTDGVAAQGDALQAATTCAAAKTARQAIVRDYRVYAVVSPQVALVLAGDAGTSSAASLQATIKTLDAAVAHLPAGDVKEQAEDLAADYAHQIATAASDFAGVADAALAESPQDYPDSTKVFAAQSRRAAAGAKALGLAAQDASKLAALLQG